MVKKIYTQGELKRFQTAKDKGYDMEIFHNHNKQKIWNMPTINQWDKVPKIYSQDGFGDNAKVHIKLFTPDRTYYITEFDKKTGDMFGYVRVEGGDSEWGYSNFNELKKAVAQSRGLYYLDRDRYFTTTSVGDLKKKGEIK